MKCCALAILIGTVSSMSAEECDADVTNLLAVRSVEIKSDAQHTQPANACLQKHHIAGTMAALNLEQSGAQGLTVSGCPPTHPIDPPRTRFEIGSYLSHLNYTGVGVEVGVQKGFYTRKLLQGWRRAKMFIQVDLWEHQENYEDLANVGQDAQNVNMQMSCTAGQAMKQQGYTQEVLQCKDYSTECAKLIPDDSIDFIYIDARHDRKGVLEDLQHYWPKLREGGMIAGHDYMEQFEVPNQNWSLNYDGSVDETGRVVKGAVDDFFSGVASESPADLQKCPRQPVITYREPATFNSWMVRK
mmetsp:Transcript_6297/g.11625  ORF Transcript_6297/g.11625 Transcript_6297/m.11625 type:complete len:300 (-) Transcript_6297:47-946(-)